MKITTDISEVVESNKIRNKDFKHLPKIYGIYTLKGKMEGLYVIVNEFLPQPETIKRDYTAMVRGWNRIGLVRDLNRTLDEFEKAITLGFLKPEELQIASDRIKEHYPESFEFFNQYVEMLKELKEAGIESLDSHEGNLGYRDDGSLVYFDLGYGDNRVVHEPEYIEIDEMRRMIREQLKKFLNPE